MGYVYYNANPANKFVGDCTIRALSKLLNDSWLNIYDDLYLQGRAMFDLANSNAVWGEYLKANGYVPEVIKNTCPNCYTIKQFAIDHPVGSFLLATGTHVVAVIDGDYYDTGDSGNEVPIYYWRKER